MSLTPTGNPLTEEQIEEWRRFLLNEVGVQFGFSSPVGANVLCDMAKAALASARPEALRSTIDSIELNKIRRIADWIEECLPQERTAEGCSFTIVTTRGELRSILIGLKAAVSPLARRGDET